MTYRELVSAFGRLRVVVAGDVMVDEYLFGRATRISPEAPVMVVKHARTERLPGGAANVARNINAMGAQSLLVGVCGTDEGAGRLRTCLEEQSVDHVLVEDAGRATTRKVRVLADAAHQTLRIDFEDETPLAAEHEAQFLAAIDQPSDVLLLSDYQKGALTERVIREAVGSGRAAGKTVVANAKPGSLPFYEGATLVSVNRVEAAAAIGTSDVSRSQAVEVAQDLRAMYSIECLLLTLGHEGMVAASALGTCEVFARRVEVYDTAGAGDTVIATVALGMAVAGFRQEVFELAAETAACVVKRVGVATPTYEDLSHILALE